MTRREFLASAAAPAVCAPAQGGAAKYLLIDRKFIENAQGISLRVHPPRKAGAVMTGERPWEKGHIGSYFSVVEDGGLYKMWYMAFAGKGEGRLCYATSADGVKWERPSLGVVEFEGSRDNNIVLGRFREGAVSLDPVAPAEQRFKTLASFGGTRASALGTIRSGSLTLVTSPDGIHWNAEYPVLPFHPDSQNNLFWDARLGKYVAYLRGWNPLRVAVRAEIPREAILRPWPYRRAANPRYLWRIFKWGKDWPPALSTELPTVLAADAEDPPECDIYTPNVVPYGDMYLAFPSLFRHTAKPGSEPIPMAGVLEVQMAVSRDGVRFERPGRRPYIPRGLEGEVDSANVYMALGMLRRGKEIYQYYAGGSADHAAASPGRSALMLAVQRLDGFISADADGRGGEFTTPPLAAGERLRLNVDTSAMGTVRVEVVGQAGFALEDCDRVIGNDVAHEVSWRGNPRLPVPRGKPVRLRFQLRNASLYAFEFAQER